MALTHNSTIADREPSWSSVDKTALPRQAFADQGDAGLKSSWGYPHHWVQNGGEKDDNGIYTTGTMYLHTGGWQAAVNAAAGARSGQKASQSIINHLERHRGAVERYRERNSAQYSTYHSWRDDEYPPDQRVVNVYGDTAQCWANHMGFWCIESLWMQQAIASIRTGLWNFDRREIRLESASREKRPYELYEKVAIIPIHGPTMKGESKFGGTSTVFTRRMLRQAVTDPAVGSILLHVDSPGGHVSGTQELADDLDTVRNNGVPVVAYIEDLGASAAYWIASQAMSVVANATAEIGSIGTVAILTDSSNKMEREGLSVRVISTGKFKGIGVEGAPITEEEISYIRTRVQNLNQFFQSSLLRSRPGLQKHLTTVSDGRMFIAEEARGLGLLDDIMNFDDALTFASITGHGRDASKISPVRGQTSERERVVRATQHYQLSLKAFRHRQGV